MELVKTYVDRVSVGIDQVCVYIDDMYAYSCDEVIDEGRVLITHNSRIMLDHEKSFEFNRSFRWAPIHVTDTIPYQIPAIAKQPWTRLTDLKQGHLVAFGAYDATTKEVNHAIRTFAGYDDTHIYYKIPDVSYGMYPAKRLINHLLYISPI